MEPVLVRISLILASFQNFDLRFCLVNSIPYIIEGFTKEVLGISFGL